MNDYDFTQEQLNAIKYNNDMVVTACPGSGKTAIVSEKIKRALPKLSPYQGVIAISYTNKSSNELKKRCQEGGIEIKGSFFGTIDGFCLGEIIYPFIRHVWPEAHKDILITSYQDLPKKYRNNIPEPESNKLFSTSDLEVCLDAVTGALQEGYLFIDAVGALALFVINASVACRRYLRARYVRIFIDEYQDSGEPQHKLFIAIRGLGLTAVAVGDADQSIYAFSGRSPEYLIELRDDNHDFHSFEITINYRCHDSIVNYSKKVLDPDFEIIDEKEIRVFRKKVNGHQGNIAKWIASVLPNIMTFYDVNHYREVGILVRGKPSTGLVRDYIGLPCRLFEDTPLSMTNSPIANLFSSLISFRVDSSLTAQDVITRFIVKKISAGEVRTARRLIRDCRRCNDEELFDCLLLVANFFFPVAVDPSIVDCLRQVLESPYYLDQYRPINDDEIQIMTIHKAKGLEFKIVFHLDLYDWIMPRREFIQDCWDEVFQDYEQCQNLHYVGITRAEEVCVLVTSTQRYNSYMDLKGGNSSQFLAIDSLEGLYQNI